MTFSATPKHLNNIDLHLWKTNNSKSVKRRSSSIIYSPLYLNVSGSGSNFGARFWSNCRLCHCFFFVRIFFCLCQYRGGIMAFVSDRQRLIMGRQRGPRAKVRPWEWRRTKANFFVFLGKWRSFAQTNKRITSRGCTQIRQLAVFPISELFRCVYVNSPILFHLCMDNDRFAYS